MKLLQNESILLFDGVCNSCNFIVDFILKRDRTGCIRFASLQSGAGRRLLQQFGLPLEPMDTLVFIDEGRAYVYSSAAFRVFYRLGWPWKIFHLASLLPTRLTDFFYCLYASNRYRLFGKSDHCRVLTDPERSRFLEEP